jgi:hypothetical protein
MCRTGMARCNGANEFIVPVVPERTLSSSAKTAVSSYIDTNGAGYGVLIF